MSKISVTATVEMTSCIKELAKERGITADEAADALLRAGWSRLVATSKWYDKKKAEKSDRPKKARKAKAESKPRKAKSDRPKKARKAKAAEPVAEAAE